MTDWSQARATMVQEHIAARGVRDALVLDALRAVPRERFVPESVRELAYEDRPLPIAGGQTISQPYIVAYMLEALALKGGEKALEVGAGSGYAAAVLAQIASEVFTIERVAQLAETAAHNLADAGCLNVHVRHADGTEGWAEEAPFDAILVSAGGPAPPRSLLRQLKIGGRLVIPIGKDRRAQELVRVTRVGEQDYEREDLADVRFVPLIGAEGWELEESEWESAPPRVVQSRPLVSATLPGLIAGAGEVFETIDGADIGPLIARACEARVVLIGEASHGTSEFYRLRARITQRLISEHGFNVVAIEGDWPDVSRIDHYVRHRDAEPSSWTAFARFPTWMWRNAETRDFVDWLHAHNAERDYASRAAFHGLDLYSLYTSARAVIEYLEGVDPDLATVARQRYGCLSPWEADPAAYGHAALARAYKSCEHDVAHMLVELLSKRAELVGVDDGERFLDAEQNARVVAEAERYYRTMYYGSRASWNLRDRHMFDTLQGLLRFHGPDAKAVVWAHNSHIGDASATEMGARGEFNIGQLCRAELGAASRHIGFGTNDGTVAAAHAWDGPMQVMEVRPAHPQSYERLFHLTNAPGLILPLDAASAAAAREGLAKRRLERAIGVIYRPTTELASHYFEARLPQQFDEYVWIDRTRAITPLAAKTLEGLPETYPFGV